MYQVLARKWRPKNFKELVGQHHVTQALTYALDHQLIHHAYLFTGTRGVGKTTIARIFAKSLNCQTKGVSSEPCGICDHCQEIDAGRFPDLIEVDAASRSQVEYTRQLLANVPYAPVKGRYKVYLIDEVHMFSDDSFNALLKTLEEPPEHVKFILATTDPQKVPATVLSRCLQFQLKNMTATQIAGHLQTVLSSEKVVFDKEAIDLLAEAAQGSMRDSLSLLDQAIAYGQGRVHTKDVANLLGAVPAVKIRELFTELANGDAKALRETLNSFEAFSPDHTDVLRRILQGLQQITIAQLEAQRTPNEIDAEMVKIAQRLPVELVQLWYQIATDAWQTLPYQPNIALALEMTLLRMLALQPVFPEQALAQVSAIPSAYPEEKAVTSIAELAKEFIEEEAEQALAPQVQEDTQEQAQAPVEETTPTVTAEPSGEMEPPPWLDDDTAGVIAQEYIPEPEMITSVVEEFSPEKPLPPVAVKPADNRQNIHAELREALQKTIANAQQWSLFAHQYFSHLNTNELFSDNAYPIAYHDGRIELALDEIGMAWWDDNRRRQFEYEFTLLLGEQIHLHIANESVTNTYYYQKQKADEAELLRAQEVFCNHPVVARLQAEFAASIEKETIISLKK